MSGGAAPAALIMARAPRPGFAKTRLQPLLGAQGCARLQATLIARAARWALSAAPGGVHLAYDPADAAQEIAALVSPEVVLRAQRGSDLGQRLTAATGEILDGGSRPLLVVGTDLPTLGAVHARAALADLAAGCDFAVGPALDGGYYLIAIDRPRPELFALPPDVWGGPEVLALTLAAAREVGLSLGLLRSERDLDTPEDARAALADPTLPRELAALLRGAGDSATPSPPG